MIGYTIILSDSVSSSVKILPNIPMTIYKDLDAAMFAIRGVSKTMNVTPILYGSAFPYENTTFEKYLEEHGYAFYGIGDYVIDDEECRVPVGLKRCTVLWACR